MKVTKVYLPQTVTCDRHRAGADLCVWACMCVFVLGSHWTRLSPETPAISPSVFSFPLSRVFVNSSPPGCGQQGPREMNYRTIRCRSLAPSLCPKCIWKHVQRADSGWFSWYLVIYFTVLDFASVFVKCLYIFISLGLQESESRTSLKLNQLFLVPWSTFFIYIHSFFFSVIFSKRQLSHNLNVWPYFQIDSWNDF